MHNTRRLHVLVAPLDWGLGHATRCIPVIRYLLQNNCLVTLAAEGNVAILLKSNFPELEILPLEGYRITYSKYALTFVTKILSQVPKILGAIKREELWLGEQHRNRHFDLVISDNRYGLKVPNLYSVIMTHQLQIQTGKGQFADQVLRKIHYRLLEKFDQCWIVDVPSGQGLAGILSHPETLPKNAVYVGLLSQLKDIADTRSGDSKDILVLLSGPEPMRSILEKKILSQIENLPQYNFTVVAGNPRTPTPELLPKHIQYHTHLNADDLNVYIQKAALVVCRSGYSTLMDLALLQKKALLIPTPGQSEQEYLAKRLHHQNIFLTKSQSEFNLESDIEKALSLDGFIAQNDHNSESPMCAAVDKILNQLRSKKFNHSLPEIQS